MLWFFRVRLAKELPPLFQFKLEAKAPALVSAGVEPQLEDLPNRLLERLQSCQLSRGARLPALYRYHERG